MQRLSHVLVLVLTTCIRAVRLLRANWYFLVAGLLAGLAFGGIFGALQPTRYRAVAVVSLEPEVFNLSTVLSTGGLIKNYALELNSERYLARAAKRLGWPESPADLARQVRVVPDREALTLTVIAHAPTPERAVELTNGLVRLFREDVEATNLTRNRVDRLRVEVVVPAYGVVRDSPRWEVYVPVGGLSGLVVGLLVAVLAAWRRRGRISSPQEAEQVLQAPTLGLIPR